MPETQEFASWTMVHESPIHGRVLEIALAGSQSQEVSSRGRKILVDEVARIRPQYLVINLLEFNSVFGNDLLGALVAGAVSMRELGTERETRILAVGRTAATLDRILPIARLESVFGGRTYSDLESALRKSCSESGESTV
jgi:hypothetical protein